MRTELPASHPFCALIPSELIRWTEIVRKNRFLYIKVSEIKDLPKTKVGLCFLFLTG